MSRILSDKRFLLAFLLLAGITIHFWATSRYPDLGEKAAMAPETDLQGLGFDEVFDVSGLDDRPMKKIFVATVNWLESNRKGMLFGVLAAAAVMTMLELVPQRTTGNRFGDTIFGALVGAPLGVCVNCAAPIAKGMQSGGTRPETALAAMLSSPTYNPVIITLMFTLLPWYFGAIKLAFATAIIFIGTPLIVRWFGPKSAAAETPDGLTCPIDLEKPERPGWRDAFVWLGKNYPKKLWYIALRTVPLMLAAGIIGATLISVVEWREMTQFRPWKSDVIAVLGVMLAFAAIGTILPTPIAFDVIIVSILLLLGMKEPYAMILLLTLGTYSIYAQMIVTQMYNFKIGMALFVTVVLAAPPAGMAAYVFKKQHEKRTYDFLAAEFERLENEPYQPIKLASPPAAAETEVRQKLRESARNEWTPFAAAGPDLVTIEAQAFDAPSSPGEKLFARHNGGEFGLDVASRLEMEDYLLRFSTQGRAIAAGDVHNDGWEDIAITLDHAEGGFALFANAGGQGFIRQPVHLSDLSEQMIRPVSFADLNGDGWLDLVFSTYSRGLYVIYNAEGSFSAAPELIHDPGLGRVDNITFADLDRNGTLDIAMGVYLTAWPKHPEEPKASRNGLLLQRSPGQFDYVALSGPPGITHTSLFSDFDQDGDVDLITGDDFGPADVYYLNDGTGALTPISAEGNLFPPTPFFTMSVATADIDNDLDFEIFIAQVTQGDNFREFRSEFSILSTELHHHATSETERRTAKYSADYVRAARGISLKKHRAAALTVPAGNDRDSVIRYAYFWLHFQNEAPWRDWSRFAPNHPPFFDHALRQLQAPAYELSEAESAAALPPKNRRNSLLFRNPDGTWKDEAEVRNVGITAWTWNAKFADLDNDGWLDLYSANGWPRSNYRDNNTYFHNRGDGFFDMETSAAGLDDFFVTFGFVYVDYDRDGDLDIISAPPNAEVRVFTNQSAAAGRSIRFQLRDRSANRFAVGAKITIHTDDGAQIREIQGGGGYASFDPYEAHFGLGDAAVVRRVEIDWPDGETTDLSGEFVSGFCYRILRGR